MKLVKLFKNSLIVAVTLGLFGFAFVGNVGKANAIPYGQPAPENAAFNIYTDAPSGIGDEPDFVRLRRSTGSPTVPAVDNDFVDPLDTTCAIGNRFDIRTYIHNGAASEFNDNGNGTAVAHDVVVNMNAPLGVTSETFTFDSVISSSNAETVRDTGRLVCSDEVQLTLVPQSVYVYSGSYGWQNASDGAVNGSLPIGSRVPGSGDVWGCWEDRVVVVYQVEVTPVPEVPTPEVPTPEVPTPLKTIPNTGAGSATALFAGVSSLGTAVYQFVIRRRK